MCTVGTCGLRGWKTRDTPIASKAAPVSLEVALALAVSLVAAALDDRHISGQESVAGAADQLEAAVETLFREVVEEDTADAARLVAVLQEEVLVTPALEARVQPARQRRQRVAAAAVEMRRVGLDAVVRRQVHAATEPGHDLAVLARRGEHPHVHVHRRHMRVARVHDQRHAHRLERRAGQFGPVLGR